jgi:hypothetical protein
MDQHVRANGQLVCAAGINFASLKWREDTRLCQGIDPDLFETRQPSRQTAYALLHRQHLRRDCQAETAE